MGPTDGKISSFFVAVEPPGAHFIPPAPVSFPNVDRIPPGTVTDIYSFDVPCQWVDITGLGDGAYTLRVGVDESDILEEEGVHPNEVFVRVRLEGDTATVLP